MIFAATEEGEAMFEVIVLYLIGVSAAFCLGWSVKKSRPIGLNENSRIDLIRDGKKVKSCTVDDLLAYFEKAEKEGGQ